MDEDYRSYLRLLALFGRRYETRIHAYVRMSNHACCLVLGPSPGARAECYRAIVSERLSGATIDAIRDGTRKGVPLGRETFRTMVEAETGCVLGPKKRGRPRKISV